MAGIMGKEFKDLVKCRGGKKLKMSSKYFNPALQREQGLLFAIYFFEDNTYEVAAVAASDPKRGWRVENLTKETAPWHKVLEALEKPAAQNLKLGFSATGALTMRFTFCLDSDDEGEDRVCELELPQLDPVDAEGVFLVHLLGIQDRQSQKNKVNKMLSGLAGVGAGGPGADFLSRLMSS